MSNARKEVTGRTVATEAYQYSLTARGSMTFVSIENRSDRHIEFEAVDAAGAVRRVASLSPGSGIRFYQQDVVLVRARGAEGDDLRTAIRLAAAKTPRWVRVWRRLTRTR